MKKIIYFISCCILSFGVYAQQHGDSNNPYDINYNVKVTQQAHYPAGDSALNAYFFENIRYTREALDKRIYGEVVLSIFVEVDGSINEVGILESVGYGIDEEVIRCIKAVKFSPAKANGTAYRSNLIIYVPVKAVDRPVLEIEKP